MCAVLFGGFVAARLLFTMYRLLSVATSLVGLSSAAALGSVEDYASGSVHAQIMAIKMVHWFAGYVTNSKMLTGSTGAMGRRTSLGCDGEQSIS